MIDAFFIAGTDTDVGKTVVSRAILDALADKEFKTIGYKPVAAGSQDMGEGYRNSDALYLQSASTLDVDYEDANPYALHLPASPHIAAQKEGVEIQYSVLSEALARHKDKADVVLVEGAGGWRVPISASDCLSQWVQQEKLPVVLVVGIKLGCLSHAMLTMEAIKADGLDVVGWVANLTHPDTEHYTDIIMMLGEKIGAPKLGEIPYVPSIKHKKLGKYIDVDALVAKE
ncbi:dethiobiotin synthase [Vibrio ostreicida]|uniref:ATP-dependent dethiobiotin synthetase BioD n=1 Tax=Vibrio ostreicida TaxID=526588 RepID=A0ABT8BUC0_9VIBR|nr:dethiobiotin synthase [Vibrio ostreicida]MDN3609670.1 dethiobiotin synthase [Vibrio ostreicida]MDN3610998.1 dethiobiotin synthase [Vibrio ostreicida]NPD09498.1 dethiobiotin synthase [Vibrio ostreicida]